MLLYFTIISTLSDTTDPTVDLERASRSRRERKSNPVKFDKRKYSFYCDLCDTHVEAGTKHCRQCNRCTAGFDHHCSWINNDVGSANYSSFVAMLLSLIAVLVLQIATVALILKKRNEIDNRRIKVGIVFNLVEVSLALINVLYLLCFHGYLRAFNLTTFQYIRAKQNRTTDSTVIKRVQDGENPEAIVQISNGLFCCKVSAAPEVISDKPNHVNEN